MAVERIAEKIELEDIYSQLRSMGYYVAVFDFNWITQEGEEISAAPHRARVIITNTENARQKSYDVAAGNSWKNDFCGDVRNGAFGPPPRGVP
jgi:hypothetical protein